MENFCCGCGSVSVQKQIGSIKQFLDSNFKDIILKLSQEVKVS